MSAEMVYYIGIAICGVAAACAVAAAVMLRLSKTRLNNKLDAEYGKRKR